MARMRSVVVLLAMVALIASVGSAEAQVDPEIYAVPHLFSLSTATTTRLFGMGGFVTCIPDEGFANPAFASTVTDFDSVVRYSATNFDPGLKLRGEQVSVAIPLTKGKNGLQVTGFRLKSGMGKPGPAPGTPVVSFDEWDLAVHYGQRINSRWAIGVGISPVFHSSTGFHLPAPVGPVGQLQASSDEGFRIGCLYAFGLGGCLGAVYDRYDEQVTTGIPPTLQYTSEEMALGLSHPLNPRILAAVEWQQLTTERSGTRVGDSGIRFGFEFIGSNHWAVRTGSNDGAFSCGMGYQGSDWSLEYAFINNWNADNVGNAFGGSQTHQFEATYSW